MSNAQNNDSNTYDYIVVGGGSAGCIVAGRLAEAGVGSVLLLEGADRAEANPETLSADGFKYAFANDKVMLDRMSAEQAHCGQRTLYAGSGRGMGGSGSVNGMVYTRGDQLDFAQWPARLAVARCRTHLYQTGRTLAPTPPRRHCLYRAGAQRRRSCRLSTQTRFE
jgi:choline dehydrogenase-like flavoprotein